MRKFISCLAVASMLANPIVSFAAESSDFLEFYKQEANVVTASKQEEKITEAPGIIQVVTADEIKRFGATQLTDVLNRLTSVYMTGSHLFRDNVPSIRGDLSTHNDTHNLVLIDGRPYRNSQSAKDYPVYQDFPIESIDHIEVVRGPSSVLYGTGAFDGVFNIITKEAKPGKTQAAASVGGGNFGTQKYTANVGASGQDFKIYTGFQYLYSSGWPFDAFDAPFPTPNNPTHPAQYHTTDWGQKDVGANFKASYKNLKAEVFYAQNDETMLGNVPDWPDSLAKSYHLMSDLGYLQPLNDRWDVSLNFTNNLDYDRFQNSVPGAPITFSEIKALDYLTEVTARGRPRENLDIIIGGVDNHETGPDNPSTGIPSFPKYSDDMWSGYVQADYKPIPKLKLIGGAQINAPQGAQANTVPRAGAIYNFNNEWGTKVLYGEAFRSPDNVEKHIRVPNLTGNPNLKPEQNASTDLSLFHNTEKSQTNLTFFYIKQKDLIIRQTTVVPSQTFTNQGELISRGVELESKLFPWDQMMLTGSYSYQDNRNNNGLYNTTLMPTNMVKAGATYDWPQGITFGIFNSYYTQRYDVVMLNPAVPELNPQAGAFNWLTANLQFNLNKLFNMKYAQEYTLSIYGVNLLDEAVYDPEFDHLTINTLPARTRASVVGTLSVKF
jgi:outer membrane receptor for ferrienterochelin and colicins